jgi:hypothetical protein
MKAAPRLFKDPPGQYFVQDFLAHVKKTGLPETFPGLHPGSIAKTERFLLLTRFEIDRRRRPAGNLAPCPMCQPNKYLRGSLIYIYPISKLLPLLATAAPTKGTLLTRFVNIKIALLAT